MVQLNYLTEKVKRQLLDEKKKQLLLEKKIEIKELRKNNKRLRRLVGRVSLFMLTLM